MLFMFILGLLRNNVESPLTITLDNGYFHKAKAAQSRLTILTITGLKSITSRNNDNKSIPFKSDMRQ